MSYSLTANLSMNLCSIQAFRVGTAGTQVC